MNLHRTGVPQIPNSRASNPAAPGWKFPLRDEHLQQHGFVHGGVISYLADNALTFAGGSGTA